MNTRLSTKAQQFTKKRKKEPVYSINVKLAAIKDVEGGMTYAKASKKYGIRSTGTLAKWCGIHRDGRPLQENAGRPSNLSDVEKAQFVQAVNAGSGNGYAMREGQVKEIFAGLVQENRKKRKLCDDDGVSTYSRSFKRVLQELGGHIVVADSTTDARRKAELNVNNAIGYAAAATAIMPHIDPRMVGNPDASQYVYSQEVEKAVYFGKWTEFLKQHPEVTNIKSDPDGSKEGGLGFGIKYYCFISAGGIIGDPIFIVADDNMAKDEIDVYDLDDFGFGCQFEQHSYLVFMKTRVPGKSFYRWFLESYLVPYVLKLRVKYKTESWFFLQLDGENDQIAVFDEPAVQELMQENRICVGKSSAGRTGLEQPCDVGQIFRGSKTKFRAMKLTKNHEVPIAFQEQLNAIWRRHHKKYSTKALNYDHLHKSTNGIYLVMVCLNRVVTKEMIINSFAKSGIVGRNGRVDVYKMLTACRAKISDDDIAAIQHELPKLAKKILCQRVLLDDKDFKKIPCAGNQASRDGLKSINRKGFMFLTDPKLVTNPVDAPVEVAVVVEPPTTIVAPVAPPVAVAVTTKRVHVPNKLYA